MSRGARSGANRLVYTTDSGRICPDCARPIDACACRVPAPTAGDGVARIGLNRKGRAGKDVTLVRGLALDPASLAEMGRQLRAACGCGGTVKDGAIELQGDHRDRVEAWMTAQGRPKRRVGG